MGEFSAGKWIVGLLIYFFFFFAIVVSVNNARAYYDPGVCRATVNDPGFEERGNDYLDTEKCTGTGKSMTILGTIPCDNIEHDNNEDVCNSFEVCAWKNETLLFNITISDARCDGIINKSYYNISGGRAEFCDNIASEAYCRAFKCTWLNHSNIGEAIDLGDSASAVGIWDTVKFIALFRAELGLGAFTFFFSFLFFYIPFVMLIWSLYMAVPFLH